MTELTPQEIDAIDIEARDYAWINYDKDKGDWMTFKTAYAAALTSERLKHKAEIQAYRDGLNKIIDLYPNTESKAIIALNDMRQTAFDTLTQFK